MQKMQRAITLKNKITFFKKSHQVIYSLFSISCPSLKVLAVLVFKISSFLCQNLQRAITFKKSTFFFKFSPGNLLIILYQLTKFEAPSLIVIEVS